MVDRLMPGRGILSYYTPPKKGALTAAPPPSTSLSDNKKAKRAAWAAVSPARPSSARHCHMMSSALHSAGVRLADSQKLPPTRLNVADTRRHAEAAAVGVVRRSFTVQHAYSCSYSYSCV